MNVDRGPGIHNRTDSFDQPPGRMASGRLVAFAFARNPGYDDVADCPEEE